MSRQIDVLIRATHDGADVAVWRDDDGLWLGDPEAGWAVGVEGYRPEAVGLDGHTALGGAMPPRGANVEIADGTGEWRRADVRRGAWLAIVPAGRGLRSDPIVRFLDAAGELVRRPLPASVETETIVDATVPCPVCDMLEWQAVRSAPEGLYGESGGRPSAAVCAHCGFEFTGLGSITRFDEDETEPLTSEDMARIESSSNEIVEESQRAVREAGFPIFGLEPSWQLNRSVDGHGSDTDRVTEVTLGHGDPDRRGPAAQVTTRLIVGYRDDLEEHAVRAYETAARGDADDWPTDLSHEALSLWLIRQDETSRRAALNQPRAEVEFDVDSTPTSFVVVGDDDAWGAAASTRTCLITVSARAIPRDEFRLVAIDDFEPYVEGLRDGLEGDP